VIYPSHFEEKIGFNKIRKIINDYCLGSLGKENVELIAFSNDLKVLDPVLDVTAEYLDILTEGKDLPLSEYSDTYSELERIRLPGTYLEPEVLGLLRIDISISYECIQRIKSSSFIRYQELQKLAALVTTKSEVVDAINKILDENLEIRDNASQKLSGLRKQIRQKIVQNERRINQLIIHAREMGWTSPDAELTIRQGRFLIPLQATHKRKMAGYIHDESATGQTVFLEPAENFELNNEIRDLENDIRREIIRILITLADFIRPYADDLNGAYQLLGSLDLIRAKAKFGIQINAIKPDISTNNIIDWKKSIHPLLFLSHSQKKKEIVPLDISIDQKHRILIISGPNAGGKSVCLKTVGLLQYMMQCGFLVPMDPYSIMGIFNFIFLEIGDEQSIDQDLSTYSSHLNSIKYLIKKADSKTLFLIDEFGAGTDPQLGGALAEACLEYLVEKGAMGIATTHYSNLKLLASEHDVITNGAMLFDTVNMKPLYRLLSGKPGSSFAFEIASRIGLPQDLIKKAARKTGKTQLDFEQQLNELESEKIAVEKSKIQFKVADDFLSEQIETYQAKLDELEETKLKTLDDARKKATEIIDKSNRLIENTIREIRESNAEKEKTKKLRDNLRIEASKIIKENIKSKSKPKRIIPEKESQPLKVGDWATRPGTDQDITGRIIEISGNNVTLDLNGISFRTKMDSLTHAIPSLIPKSHKTSGTSYYSKEIQKKSAAFKLTIDIRGKNSEEACHDVQKFIDDAILLSTKEVSILHGKGNGILRRVIREFLAGIDQVEGFRDEHVERGGSGITLVKIK